MSKVYLTRAEVAERYPISQHTLAQLASAQKGPRFFKPTDKALYLAEDIEAWIEAAAVLPRTESMAKAITQSEPALPKPGGRGRASGKRREPTIPKAGRKSLPPSPNSWLLRNKD